MLVCDKFPLCWLLCVFVYRFLIKLQYLFSDFGLWKWIILLCVCCCVYSCCFAACCVFMIFIIVALENFPHKTFVEKWKIMKIEKIVFYCCLFFVWKSQKFKVNSRLNAYACTKYIFLHLKRAIIIYHFIDILIM